MQSEETEDYDLLIATQMLDKAEQTHGPQSDQVVDALVSLAKLFHERESYLESLGYFMRAREILEAKEDKLSARMSDIFVGIGEHYLVQDMPSEARAYYEKALSIRNALFIDENIDTAHIHAKTGEILCLQGELTEAAEHLFRALQIYTIESPEAYCELGDVTHNIGILLFSEEENARAVEYLKEAVKNRSMGYGELAQETGESLSILSECYERLNDSKNALHAIYKAISAFEENQDDNQDVIAVLKNRYQKLSSTIEDIVSIPEKVDAPIQKTEPEIKLQRSEKNSKVVSNLIQGALAALDQNSIEIARDILRIAHRMVLSETTTDSNNTDHLADLLSRLEAKIP